MQGTIGMASGLRRRLIVLLLLPLFLLSLLNTWFDLRTADSAALQQDRQLRSLIPLLASSVVAKGSTPDDPPVLLKAPLIDDFLNSRPGQSAMAIVELDGTVLLGDTWLHSALPMTNEPEFASDEHDGLTYRIVSQRAQTPVGEMVVRLADGSDQRQQWLRLLWVKVFVPNLVLMVAALFAVNWAVNRALRPLLTLKAAVEQRSPRDLSALETEGTPEEVRPLVRSLNTLFELVNAQASSQRRFIADAAHQLRTPLAGLQAQVEAWAQAAGLVSDGHTGHAKDSPVALTLHADQIFKLRQAVRRTSQLANQLLALSRADASSANTQSMTRVDLRQLCEVMLETHLDAASAKSIDLGLDTQPVHATGHEWLLREMLSNLVDNAIRYTPPNGHVTLRCGLRRNAGNPIGLPYLEVEDDGPGVPPAHRKRMLERFYRLPGTSGEGTGLGLAIADEIARVHHSALQVSDGAMGKGLRIALTLPA
jgi:two-component system, OmpR family, sensor histidine kinase TctE